MKTAFPGFQHEPSANKMKVHRKRQLLPSLMVGLAVGGLGVYLLSPSSASSTTTMYLSPASANVTVNDTFTVAVRVNAGEPINAVEANLNYDASQLQFVSINNTGSAFATEAPSSGGNGTVSINRGQIGGVTGDQLVATVTFKALVANVSSSIIFNGDSQALRNSDSGQDLRSATGGTYALKAVATTPTPAPQPTPPPAAKTPAPAPTPTTPTHTPSPSTSPPSPASPPTAATPPATTPKAEDIQSTPPTSLPKTTIVDSKTTSTRGIIAGATVLSLLVLAAISVMLFVKRRQAMAMAGANVPAATVSDFSHGSTGPSAPVPSAPVVPGTVTTPSQSSVQPVQTVAQPKDLDTAVTPQSDSSQATNEQNNRPPA